MLNRSTTDLTAFFFAGCGLNNPTETQNSAQQIVDQGGLSLSWLVSTWHWARTNDLPNWFVFAFTVILWPVALILWQRRKANGVPGLEVHFSEGQITFGGKSHRAIDIQFTNHTGSVVYVSGVRIRGCTNAFPVPVEASRDVAENAYHLKFMNDNGQFANREVTLQTSAVTKTCMPVTVALSSRFFGHSSSWLYRRLRRRRYFILEYTVMVGTARHSIATRY